MDQGLNQFLKKICKEQAGTLVGRICKQIEVVQKEYEQRIKTLELAMAQMPDTDDRSRHLSEVRISEIKKSIEDLSLLKNFNKELIYQEFRDLREAVIFYTEGREHQKIPIYNPQKDK